MKKFLSPQNGLCLILFLGVPVSSEAATLTGHLYLSVPWGKALTQVGHALPQKEGDESAAGPSGLAVDSQGRVGLLDIQNDRIQLWGQDQRLLQTVPCSSFGRCPNGIAVDGDNQWYFSAGRSLFTLRYTPNRSETPHSFLELTPLGVHFPDEIETGVGHTLFVNDNETFTTYQLANIGKIDASFPKDARWFALASRGFWATHADVRKEYSGKKDTDIMVLGISNGVVITVHSESQASQKALRLDGWTLDGHKAFSIPLNGIAAKLLDPARVGEIRPARVGEDGAIYSMDEPDSDAFHVYRFEISP